ncbi:hypothetical protein ACUN24_13020 [Pedobacter sp. WC2501]|uniref:hypothetical protein n=1 Tax=Pedobacter sp. WC2501 TaxID=3461400 RepID=UPI00404549E6
MKIIRRISGKIEDSLMKKNLEILLNEDIGTAYFSKDMEEDSHEYEMIAKIVDSHNLHDSIIGTKFSSQEILDSEILVFTGGRAFAYPQPESPDYLTNTYNDSCLYCGVFGEQENDFVIKKEPDLKKQKVMTLNWVFGELFAEINSYDLYFKPMGLDSRTLSLSKGGKIAEHVVQVIIPSLEKEIKMDELEFSKCPVCSRIKYIPSTIGFSPKPEIVDFNIVKTVEFFGTGHSANHKILVNHNVMRSMIEQKMAKLHQFVPCR